MFDFIHAHIIGASGSGKSTLLKRMAIEKMHAGEGVLFIDPLGHNSFDLLQYVPRKRQHEVVYVDLADIQYPLAWNPLFKVDHPVRTAKSITTAFKRGFRDDKTPRLDIVLTNAILAAIEAEGTLTSVLRFMEDVKFRCKTIEHLDGQLESFWKTFPDTYPMRDKPFESSVSRVRALLDSPECRAILQQPIGKFTLDSLVDSKKIIIINGAQGTIGEEPCRLFISIFLDLFHVSCMREPLPHHITVIIDEFWMAMTDVVARALSVIRNYNISFVLAHQFVDQVDENIMSAVVANTDAKFVYKVSTKDARILAPEFKDHWVTLERLADLSNYEAMVLSGEQYHHVKMPPLSPPASPTRRDTVIRNSRARFARKLKE